MKQPTQEQLNDPAWWDENAGTASHYCPTNKQFYDSRLHPCCFTRPTKPAAPEWDGEGLPPVGCECECASIENNGQASWCKVKIVAFGKATVCMESLENIVDAGKWDLFVKDAGRVKFRSIRTKEQREREEVIEAAMQCGTFVASDSEANLLAKFARDLYNAGLLRKGGE